MGTLGSYLGTPQGSTMGPEDYKVYTLSVGDIVRTHEMDFHGYADDTRNYTEVKLNNTLDFQSAIDWFVVKFNLSFKCDTYLCNGKYRLV